MAKRQPRTGTLRTTVLGVRVSDELRREIEDAAIEAGMTVSAHIAATLAAAIAARHEPKHEASPPANDSRQTAVTVSMPGMHHSFFPLRWSPQPTPTPPAVAINPADPAVLHELKRIGNNINQIAHATNSGLPPSLQLVAQSFHHLFEALTDAEEFKRRIAALRTRTDFNGAAHAQSRVELQMGVPVRPARPRREE